ncbi:hypothetical protein [Brevundimonas vesicularis]|uniref:hypothetical protein n=1 Tax=Brevundimonas vesicularis TaxID=41276 RepID=UPI0038D4B14C
MTAKTAIRVARAMLHEPPVEKSQSLRLLAAAAFAAVTAIMLAGTMVVGPATSMDKGTTTSTP